MKLASAILASLFLFLPSQPQADNDQQLCLCRFVAPVYPPFVRQVHIDGTVHVAIVFDSTGAPTTVDALRDGPLPESLDALRNAAVEAVKKWRFCPSASRTERNKITVTFEFALRETGSVPTDRWSPTEVSFEPPAIVNVTTTAFQVTQRHTQ